jgi:hypothetical protein
VDSELIGRSWIDLKLEISILLLTPEFIHSLDLRLPPGLAN